MEVGLNKENLNTEAGGSKSAVDRLVIPGATGYVTYDVHVHCPHCGKSLYLNQYPYNDDQTEYCLFENKLGLVLFGTITKPAKWAGLNIEYTCCGCQEKFKLEALEV